MTKVITKENMQRVAEALRGTCNSLDAVLEEELGVGMDQVPIEMLQELDDMVFECTACGWWCEIHEGDENNVCDDCRDE